MTLNSPNRFTTSKLYFFSLQIVITLVLTLAIPTISYAEDCKAAIAELKQDVQDLEKREKDSYQRLNTIEKTSIYYDSAFSIWKLDSQLFKAKKDLLIAIEKSCLDSASSTDKKATAVTEDDGKRWS